MGRERNRTTGIKVVKWLREHGPATATEIGAALEMKTPIIASALKHADDWFVKADPVIGPHGRWTTQWALLPDVVLPDEGAVGIEAEIYAYLQQSGKSTVEEMADELGYARVYLARILNINPHMFRRAGKFAWATLWEHIKTAEQQPAIETDNNSRNVVKWTHTQPNGRSWTLSGRVIDRTADGDFLVLSHGELFEVAA